MDHLPDTVAALTPPAERVFGAPAYTPLSKSVLPESVLPESVRRALDLLRANAAELGSGALSLDTLSRAVCSTPSELSRAFRESLGLRPLEVVLLFRLDRSLGLLEHTTLPIAEVAALCGFLGAPHYLKVFWSAFSMTPFDYREGCGKGRARRLQSTSLAGLIAQRVLEAGTPNGRRPEGHPAPSLSVR